MHPFFLCFGVASGHASPYSSLESRDTLNAPHQLETWIATGGYAVVTLLLDF